MSTTPGVLTAALEQLWDTLRGDIPELPTARIAVSPAPPSSNHGPERWAVVDGVLTGLVINAQTLSDGAEATLTGVLHEAAHVLCWIRGVKDTTMRGGYHNARYMFAAGEVGLYWPEDKARDTVRGFASPELTDASRAKYAAHLRALRPAIDQTIPYLTVPEQPRSTRPDRLTVECQCSPPRKLRISQTVLAQGPVVCGVCGQHFQVT